MQTKILILGAGPSGLTVGNCLKNLGFNNFLIVEKESTAGGLCRSEMVDGSPLDMGGGHFLDVKLSKVNKFLFSFMPENEWIKFNRDSKISVSKKYIDHPFEANIWQFDIEEQIAYLKDIAMAGCNTSSKKPEKFVDWIYWKLGQKIASDYMIPYNKKMFADDLDILGTYWLEKLPNVSFEDTLRSCLEKKAYGTQPGHSQFYYPKKYGYGELWKRMALNLGNNIIYNFAVNSINFDRCSVKDTEGMEITAQYIITTIPWAEFKTLYGIPNDLKQSLSRLKYSSIEIRYFSEIVDSKAHWIYYPDLELPYHRKLLRHNFLNGSKGFWTETRVERVHMFKKEASYKHLNKYAYPINTIEKPVIMNRLLEWSKIRNVIGLGRWGEHQHYNSDITVELAMNLAEKILN